jgi:hypothetical protein
MIKRTIPALLVLALAAAALTAGCSVLGENASEVARNYWTAVAAKDYDVAYDLLAEKSKQAMAGRIAQAMIKLGTEVTTSQAYDALESNQDNVRVNFLEGSRQSLLTGFNLKEADFGKGIEVLSSTRNGDITEVIIGIGEARIPTRIIQEKSGNKVLIFDKVAAPKKKESEKKK